MSRLAQLNTTTLCGLRSLRTNGISWSNATGGRAANLPAGINMVTKRYEQKVKGPIKVKLLTTVPELGIAGQVIEVPAGRMRYELYPGKLAQYVIREHKQFSRRLIEGARTHKQGTQPEAMEESEENVLMKLLRVKKSNKPTTSTKQGTGSSSSGLHEMNASLATYIKLAKLHESLRHLPPLEFFKSSIPKTKDEELLALSQPNATNSKGEALYGSVTLDEVLRDVRSKHQVTLEREWVKLDKIKRTGEYLAEIDLGNNLGLAWLRILVISERDKNSYLEGQAAERERVEKLKNKKI